MITVESIRDRSGREASLLGSGALPVGLTATRLIEGSIPVLDTSAYAAGDALHIAPLITFNGVLLAPSFSNTVTFMRVDDSTATPQNAAGELWLFDRQSITLPSLNAAWTLVAGDRSKLVNVIPFGPYYTSTATGVSLAEPITKLVFSRVSDTNLYGLLVTRGAPTYTASSLKVTIGVSD